MNNPKQAPGRATWYRYNAGFSLAFARDAVQSLGLGSGAHLLDPWCGSGTTLVAVSETGLRSTGIDVNPALVVVARGRLLPWEVQGSLRSIAEGVLELAQHADLEVSDDPLGQWFEPSSATRLRRVEWAIQHLLVNHGEYRVLSSMEDPGAISSLAAFYYVALFEVVRDLASRFRSSNPTWIKSGSSADLVEIGWPAISEHLNSTVARLADGLTRRASAAPGRSRVLAGDSTRLPLEDDSVDAVVTSPPYCTRIDYVVSTLPELAVLGFSPSATRKLRDQMIGTPTMHVRNVEVPDEWGPKVAATLGSIMSHSSKASSTYYYRNHWQYFAGMSSSLDEIARVVRPNGKVLLVVQDSYYKDIHVDLPELISDMARVMGWSLESRTDFATSRSLAQVNPGSRRYRQTFRAVEAVLTLST